MLVITRPGDDGLELCARLSEQNIAHIYLPIMEFTPIEINHQCDTDTAWVFTSANGVRALCQLTALRAPINYAVGPMTANIMQQNGFHNTHLGGGDSKKLAEYMQKHHNPNIALTHYGAEEAEESLVKTLQNRGFTAQKITLYYMKPLDHIAPNIWAKMVKHRNELIFSFFSPRTVQRTAELIFKTDPHFPLLRAVVISQSIAQMAQQYGFDVTINQSGIL